MSKLCRNFFSATVTLPAATATSLETLMRDSILHWGWQDSSQDEASMDSFYGSEGSFVPDAAVYVGSDQNVRNANADPLYQGTLVAANANYSLQDPGMRGFIDPATIWLYSAAGANLGVTFQGA